MNFVATLLAGLVALVSAEDKHRGGCHCSKEEAVKIVLGHQAELQQAAQTCDFQKAMELALPTAGWSTSDRICQTAGCCYTTGTISEWWTYFACYDTLHYSVPQDIRFLANGTVVVNLVEFQDSWDFTASPVVPYNTIYNDSYLWFPVKSEKGCDYRLGYINANSLNCPPLAYL